MSRKNRLKPTLKPTLAESKRAIGFGVGILSFLVATFIFGDYMQSTRPSPQGPDQVPIYFKRVADALPFLPTLDPSQFQISSIREAYSVAKQIPAVLAQQPCYCYCQRQGHRSLLDCFRDLHATSCDICINEARLAGQLHGQGKTTEEIRAETMGESRKSQVAELRSMKEEGCKAFASQNHYRKPGMRI